MSPVTSLAAYLPNSIGSALAFVAVAALLVNGIYNRYFHPLRNVPGPFWASVTDFWKLWICMTKESHTRGLQYHRRYGPVVRVAPNLVAFNDPKLLPKIYHRYVDKSNFYSTGILGDIAPPFQTQKHAEHAAKRKRIAPSFSISNLKKLESEVDAQLIEFIDILRNKYAKTGANLDFAQWIKWFVYDTVSYMAFGKPVGFVREGKDVSGLIQCFHNMAPLAGLVGALPWLMNPILKNPFFGRSLMPKAGDGSGTGKIMQYRDNMLKDRLDNRFGGKDHGDFLHNIMHAKNSDGSYMTIEEIKTEAFVLMVAAADTSSAFFGPFVHHVSQNDKVHAKLVQEIESFESAGKLSAPIPRLEETAEMPYLNACIKETLRFSPSTPFILPRIAAKGGVEVSGYYMPEGTEIGANPYIVHRDYDVFGEDSEVFRPERWLESEERAKEMDKYILTWGYGTRICLGKNIAEMMIRKLCLQLFRSFRFQSVSPEKPWTSANMAIMIYWDQWLNIQERVPETDKVQV